MIYIIGYMGVGKTTLAKRLAEQLQLPFLDTDLEIEKKKNKSVSEIFKKEGELNFRMLETELLTQLNTKAIIACGGGLAVHNNNMELINSKGISIYLGKMVKRIIKKSKLQEKRKRKIKYLKQLVSEKNR